MTRISIMALVAAFVIRPVSAAAGDAAAEVRAVFAAKCAACHGPDLAKPKGRFGYVLDLVRVANNREMVVPFRCEVGAHDPYVAKEVADVLGVRLTSLDHVMADSDVIVCLAPLTPTTRRMVGERELALIRPGSALVNVSRGPIFDPDATIARLARGDIAGYSTTAAGQIHAFLLPASGPMQDLGTASGPSNSLSSNGIALSIADNDPRVKWPNDSIS